MHLKLIEIENRKCVGEKKRKRKKSGRSVTTTTVLEESMHQTEMQIHKFGAMNEMMMIILIENSNRVGILTKNNID